MAKLSNNPQNILGQGNKTKIIEEYFGKISTNQEDISIAVMEAPSGWIEPAQIAEFDEYTYVMRGILNVKTKDSSYIVYPRTGILIEKGEWVQYSTPDNSFAQYIAICKPAFQEHLVKRDEK